MVARPRSPRSRVRCSCRGRGRPVAALSTGQRRLAELARCLAELARCLAELARCLAGEFNVLLRDEPSSGLDRAETERFGAVLTRVVAERGVGILLVEHDMALVMNVCDYVHVLDFGTKIFEGTTADTSGVGRGQHVEVPVLHRRGPRVAALRPAQRERRDAVRQTLDIEVREATAGSAWRLE